MPSRKAPDSPLGEVQATAIITSYIQASYARLRRDYDEPLPALSEQAQGQLRGELTHAMTVMEMLGRQALIGAEFSIGNLAIVTHPDGTVELRCVERFSQTYDADVAEAREAHGAKRHSFTVRTSVTGEAMITSHSVAAMSAEEEDLAKARAEASESRLRQLEAEEAEALAAAAERAKTRENVPDTDRPRASRQAQMALVAVLALLTMVGVILYRGAPVTTTTRVSLHTGESHTRSLRWNRFVISDSYQSAPYTEWAQQQVGLPREEQLWLTADVRESSWFGREVSDRLVAPETQMAGASLMGIYQLSRKDPRRATELYKRYRQILAGKAPPPSPSRSDSQASDSAPSAVAPPAAGTGSGAVDPAALQRLNREIWAKR